MTSQDDQTEEPTEFAWPENLPHLAIDMNPKGLILVGGATGSGKTHAIIGAIDKIQRDSEKAHRATTKLLNPLLERAIEHEVGLTLHVGQKPNFQENLYVEPDTFESDAEVTADQLEDLIKEFVSLTPPNAWELRYVLNDKQFEVSVERGKSVWFHKLEEDQPSRDQERVVLTSNGSCIIYGDK